MGYVFRRSTAFRYQGSDNAGVKLGQERHRAERQHSKHLVDEWSGFAALLANLIEKYAVVLDLDALPDLVIEEAVPEKDESNKNIHENDIEPAKAA